MSIAGDTWIVDRTSRTDRLAAIRDRIDLAAVATVFLAPAPGRRGEKGRPLVEVSVPRRQEPIVPCQPDQADLDVLGCCEEGDAAALVMKLRGLTFPEAVAYLTGKPAPSGKPTRPRPPAASRPSRPPQPRRHPRGCPWPMPWLWWRNAAARLWTPEGADALAYLGGRGLTRGDDPPPASGGRPGDIAGRDGIRYWRARDRHPLDRWRPPGAGQDPPARVA